MLRRTFVGLVVVGVTVGIAQTVSAALITQLSSFADFTSATISSQDFEISINNPEFIFSSTAERIATNSAQAARSGTFFLAERGPFVPLEVAFPSDVIEIGFFVGNDDPNNIIGPAIFDVSLEIFDASNFSIGSVSITTNNNDLIDQFLGLRSDMAISSAIISYPSPFTFFGVAIDDFAVGSPVSVAEPASLTLFASGLAGLGLIGWRRRRKAVA